MSHWKAESLTEIKGPDHSLSRRYGEDRVPGIPVTKVVKVLFLQST